MRNFLSIFAAFYLVPAIAAWGWDIPIEQRHLIGGTADFTPIAGVAGDIDRDGDVDAVIQTTADNLVWLENIDAATSNWVGHVVYTNCTPAALGDFDADGDLDILSLSNVFFVANQILWHENDGGTGTNWITHTVDDSLPGTVFSAAQVADIDRDGSLDFVISFDAPTPLRWYSNGGTGPWTQHRITEYSVFQIGDMDRDGDPDVTAHNTGGFLWYENQSGVLSNWTSHLIATGYPTSVTSHTLLDADSDGDLDLATGYDPEGWYANDGSGGGWAFNSVPTLFIPTSLRSFDFDRDGDEDILSEDSWYDNPGRNGTFWQTRPLGSLFPLSEDILELADFDGDGDTDVLVATSPSHLYWIENELPDDSITFRGATTIATNLPDVPAMRAADLDRDGDVDLVAASAEGRLSWFANSGPATGWSERVIASNAALDFIAMAVGDLDSDGDPDVAACANGASLFLWFENTNGLASAWLAHTVSASIVSIFDVEIQPISPDAAPDLAASLAFDDEVRWWRNQQGAGTNFIQNIVTNDVNGAVGLDLGDINHDGRLDMVAAAAAGNRVVWLESPTGTGSTNWELTVIATSITQANDVAVADFDADGDLDVAAAAPGADKVYYFRNLSGDGTNWSTFVVDNNLGNPSHIATGDFNRDGRADLAATETNRVTIWYNTGVPGVWVPLHGAMSNATPIAVADYDDDGDLDVAAASGNGNRLAWFEKMDIADLTITKKGPATFVKIGDPCSFAITVTNRGPGEASAVTVTDALPGEFSWTSDSAGAGPPAGSNLVWSIGALLPYQSTSWTVNAVVAPTAAEGVVTNRVTVMLDELDFVATNDTAYAGIVIVEFGVVATGFLGAADAVLADFDRDGRLDIIACASNASAITGFRNLGGGTNWSTYKVTTTFTNPVRLAAADFDRDGDVDVAACSPVLGQVAWWTYFAASGSTSNPVMVATGDTGVNSLEAADIDRDGDADLLACRTGTSSVVWYRNGGGPATDWVTRIISSGIPRPADAVAVDIDRDGDLDVVAAYTSDLVINFLNLNGVGTLWSTNLIDGAFNGASTIAAADMDGDGDPDVIAGARGPDNLAWWENLDGAGNTWTQRDVTLSFGGISDVEPVDWDKDGDMDLVASGSNADAIQWWENLDRKGRYWMEHELVGGALGAASIAVGNIDKDGGGDWVTSLPGLDRVKWGAGEPPDWPAAYSDAHRTVLTSDWNTVNSMDLFDADGDGDLDLAAISRTNLTLRLWKNLDRSGTRWSARNVDTLVTGMTYVTHADLDRDGDQDLLATKDIGHEEVLWWENIYGNGETWTRHTLYHGDLVYAATRLVVHDMDRDGDPDVVVAGSTVGDGYVYWLRNMDGAAGAWTTNLVSLLCTNAYSIDAGDLDADGDPDLVVGGNPGAVSILENLDGSATNWAFIPQPFSSGENHRSVRIAHIDQNGVANILYTRTIWIAYFKFNTPGSFTSGVASATVDNMAPEVTDAEAVDFDGDGDIDIIGTSLDFSVNTGRVAVFENVTTNIAEFKRGNDIGFDLKGAVAVVTGDIDGDGDSDIAAAADQIEAFNTLPDLAWWPNQHAESLIVDKHAAPTSFAGSTSVTWTIIVSNGLPATATSVKVTDYFPPGVTWVSDSCGVGAPVSNLWTWNAGSILSGASASCTVTALVSSAVSQDVVNVAWVTGTAAGLPGTNDQDAAVTAFNAADFDNDGIPDDADPDDDNDGMPDTFENLHGLNPFDAGDADDDDDGDTIINLFEYIADTVPTNGLNFFKLTAITGSLPRQVSFSGSAARIYTLQFNTNLVVGGWSNLTGQVDMPGLGAIQSLPDTNSTLIRNYRIQVEVP